MMVATFSAIWPEIVARVQSLFVDDASLVKKLNFLRICLPIVVLLSGALSVATDIAVVAQKGAPADAPARFAHSGQVA